MTLHRLLFFVGAACLSTASFAQSNPFAGNPSWWQTRGVLVPNASATDYAVVNQGQLKKMASAAFDECATKIPGFSRPPGQPDALRDLVNGWATPGTADFAVVNQGQVKALGSMFFDRFADLRLWPRTDPKTYPWQDQFNSPDHSPINAGQLKRLFQFFFPGLDPYNDKPHPNEGFHCGAGAFPITLPEVNGVGGAAIDWSQGSGPGSGMWRIPYTENGWEVGPNPGYAVISPGNPHSASICVAGDYTFGARITYPNEPLVGIGFVSATYQVRHSPSDNAINFAVGGVIRTAGEGVDPQWQLLYNQCVIKTEFEFGSCTGPSPAIIDGRQRALPWSSTQSNLADNIHQLKFVSTAIGNICQVWGRFTAPEGVTVQISGPGYGAPDYANREQSEFQNLTRMDDYYFDFEAQDQPAAGVHLPPTTVYLFRFIRP